MTRGHLFGLSKDIHTLLESEVVIKRAVAFGANHSFGPL
jgi:hypothetical protein